MTGALSPDLRCLRVACDQAKVLYDHPAPWGVFQAADWPEMATLDVGGTPLGLVRSAHDPEALGRVVYAGEGLRVMLRRPEDSSREKGLYSAELTVQGLACSTTRDGLEAVDSLRWAVEEWLWPGEDVSEKTLPGMLDVCVDVEALASREDGTRWIEEEIFQGGNIDRACGRFSTRSSARTRELVGARMLGSKATGRTLYLGKDPGTKVYQKDVSPGRDLPLVEARWREAGWDGQTRVVRIEASVSRTWLADNEVRRPDGGEARHLAGPAGMTWLEARRWIPSIGRGVLERTRMRETQGKARTRARHDAPLWRTALDGLAGWDAHLAHAEGHPSVESWRGVGEIVSRAREWSRERATKRVEKGLAELLVHAAADDKLVTVADVARSVSWAVERGEGRYTAEQLDKAASRIAWKLGLPRPPSVLQATKVSHGWATETREPSQGERAVAELRALVKQIETAADLAHEGTRAIYDELRAMLARLEGGDG